MVELEVSGGRVNVEVLGAHRFWALRRRFTFDRIAVTAVGMAERTLNPPWLRMPGTYLPGVIAAGTYHDRRAGRKEFWDTRFKGQAIRIDLAGAGFTRIVVDVADPAATIAALGDR
ncbi:hypothetical protein [Nocardia sp. NPDC052566]|uniref:hypothetical protein n=1 Tax=Nocardia sp. NPDC052566 TaxID=3364330 RepID=UPI0037C6D84B